LVGAAIAFIAVIPTALAGGGAPRQPRHELNAGDMRRARAAVLTSADLPSWGFRSDPGAVPQIPVCGDYPGDRSGTTETGKATSSFSAGTPIIGSKVLFFKTPPDLDRYWKLTVRKRFASCDVQTWARDRRDMAAKPVWSGQLPLGATGADDAVAFRSVIQTSTAKYPRLNWYRTFVFIRHGRGLAILMSGEAVRPCTCYTTVARRLALRLIDASVG
jgi:hypothetical protein